MSSSIIKKLNEIAVLHSRFSGEALRSRGNKKIKTEVTAEDISVLHPGIAKNVYIHDYEDVYHKYEILEPVVQTSRGSGVVIKAGLNSYKVSIRNTEKIYNIEFRENDLEKAGYKKVLVVYGINQGEDIEINGQEHRIEDFCFYAIYDPDIFVGGNYCYKAFLDITYKDFAPKGSLADLDKIMDVL